MGGNAATISRCIIVRQALNGLAGTDLAIGVSAAAAPAAMPTRTASSMDCVEHRERHARGAWATLVWPVAIRGHP